MPPPQGMRQVRTHLQSAGCAKAACGLAEPIWHCTTCEAFCLALVFKDMSRIPGYSNLMRHVGLVFKALNYGVASNVCHNMQKTEL